MLLSCDILVGQYCKQPVCYCHVTFDWSVLQAARLFMSCDILIGQYCKQPVCYCHETF